MKHDIFHVVLSPDWLLVVFDFVLIASSLFACKYLVVRLHRYGGDLFSQGHMSVLYIRKVLLFIIELRIELCILCYTSFSDDGEIRWN